jgi:hypothetical protein
VKKLFSEEGMAESAHESTEILIELHLPSIAKHPVFSSCEML